jgi:dynein heavy chain
MTKWLRQKEKFEVLITTLDELFTRYIPTLINLIFEGINGDEMGPVLQFALPRTNLNLVQQLTRMLDCILNEDDPIQDPD